MRSAVGLLLFAAALAAQNTPAPADKPAPRTDPNSIAAHSQLLEKARQGLTSVAEVLRVVGSS